MQPARERDKLEVLFLSQGGERVGWPWREGWPSLELALLCSYGRGRKMLSKAASLHYSFGKGSVDFGKKYSMLSVWESVELGSGFLFIILGVVLMKNTW